MGALLGPSFPSSLGLAVSGGGDSMAMLALCHGWARRFGVTLRVVTVNHGLRSDAADEAAMVARECALLGHAHDTLRWQWDGQGNKMDAARRGRLALFEDWRGDLRHVLVAHTRDDLAETFLMRLTRGSGVDGLAAMAPMRAVHGYMLVRPCLDMSRAELRHYVTTLKVPFVDDPSNDDPAYDRARIRADLPALEALGLDRGTLAATAERLREDREALARRALQVWCDVGREEAWGGLSLAPGWHDGLERATRRRLLRAALTYVSAAEYGPRGEALDHFCDMVVSGGAATLHGCAATFVNGWLTIFREHAAVMDQRAGIGTESDWDHRWYVQGNEFNGLTLRALGEDGWRQLREQADGPPHRIALSLPAIWQGDRVMACDGLGYGPGATIGDLRKDRGGFANHLLSH